MFNYMVWKGDRTRKGLVASRGGLWLFGDERGLLNSLPQ